MQISKNVVIGDTILDKAPELLTYLMKYPDQVPRQAPEKKGKKSLFSELKKMVLGPDSESFDPGEEVVRGRWFVITTTPIDHNLMYIMSGAELERGWIDARSLRVLGIAGSAQEGRDLAGRIVEESIADGAVDHMKEYLESF